MSTSTPRLTILVFDLRQGFAGEKLILWSSSTFVQGLTFDLRHF